MRKYNIPKSNAYLCPLIKNHLIPRKDKGFTLIELLIVIGIIGILSGMIMVNFSGTTDKARLAKAREFSQSILNAMGADLAGAWTFDEGTGTTAKDSWGVNHGTLKNFDFSASSGWKSASDCISGSCLQFDGVNDYVDCGNNPSLNITDAITIEAWVKENVRVASSKIASRRSVNSFYFLGSNNGKPYGGIGDGTSYTTIDKATEMPIGEWHHLAFTFIDAQNRGWLYYDGQLTKEGTITQSIGDLSGIKLSIGADIQGTNYYFNGTIDEVRIYNVALPTAQIQQHYVQGLEKLLANKAISPTEYSQRMAELGKLLADKQ